MLKRLAINYSSVTIFQFRMETADLGDGELKRFPFIKFSQWVQHLMESDSVHRLCGLDESERPRFLSEFWRRYEKLHTRHPLFDLARRGDVKLSDCIPCYIHLDEGRAQKSKALMIISLHGALGTGTRAYQRTFGGGVIKNLKRAPMPMNYCGQTWLTQFLFCSLHRAHMNDNPRLLDKVLTMLASDLQMLSSHGVTTGGKTLWVQVIGLKGDLPALVKAGSFVRSYARVPRKPGVRQACVGVCHLCLAGREAPIHIPFEDCSASALWKSTCHSEDPWTTKPMFLGLLLVDPLAEAGFFATDMWHNWHCGLCKTFLANSFVTFVSMQGIIPGNSVDAKFQWLTTDFLNFCSRNSIAPVIRELSRETFAFDSMASAPQGMWSKGSISTHLMLYLQNFCSRFVEGQTDDYLAATIVLRMPPSAVFFLGLDSD